MKRYIARWFLQRSLDDGKKPPPWVTRMLESDADLTDEYARSRDLIQQLRAEADRWTMPATAPADSSRKPRAAVLVSAAAVAAMLVVSIGWLWQRDRPEQPPLPIRQIVQGGLSPVRQSVDRSRTTLTKLSDHVSHLTSGVPLIRHGSLEKTTKNHSKKAGTLYGRSLALLCGLEQK